MGTQTETGVTVAWMACRQCSGVGRVILATAPMVGVLAEARTHARQHHPERPPESLLTLHVDDAGIFCRPDPGSDPAAWVAAVNAALPSDF